MHSLLGWAMITFSPILAKSTACRMAAYVLPEPAGAETQ
jgi:hypothetical protein